MILKSSFPCENANLFKKERNVPICLYMLSFRLDLAFYVNISLEQSVASSLCGSCRTNSQVTGSYFFSFGSILCC